jgi:hypothetical protein
MCNERGVVGERYLGTFQRGRRFTVIYIYGTKRGFGSKFITAYENKCGKPWGRQHNQRPPALILNR